VAPSVGPREPFWLDSLTGRRSADKGREQRGHHDLIQLVALDVAEADPRGLQDTPETHRCRRLNLDGKTESTFSHKRISRFIA
jgi:hypothetical protein